MTEKGWEVRFGWKAADLMGGRALMFQGKLFPSQFRAHCVRRNDGLEVEIDVRMDAESGPTATKATITQPGGLGDVGRIPFLALVRRASAALGMDPGEEQGSWIMREPKRPTDELQLVADLYRQAVFEGHPVTQFVREGLENHGIYRADSTVSKLIYRARRTIGPDGDTYLPATNPGRRSG